MVIGEGSWFWFWKQSDGVGWGDCEAETLVAICGQPITMGQRSHSHKHFDGIAVSTEGSGMTIQLHMQIKQVMLTTQQMHK